MLKLVVPVQPVATNGTDDHDSERMSFAWPANLWFRSGQVMG